MGSGSSRAFVTWRFSSPLVFCVFTNIFQGAEGCSKGSFRRVSFVSRCQFSAGLCLGLMSIFQMLNAWMLCLKLCVGIYTREATYSHRWTAVFFVAFPSACHWELVPFHGHWFYLLYSDQDFFFFPSQGLLFRNNRLLFSAYVRSICGSFLWGAMQHGWVKWGRSQGLVSSWLKVSSPVEGWL